MQKNPCRVDDPLQNPIDRESYEDAVSLEDGIYPITTDDNTIISSDMVSYGSGTVEDALNTLIGFSLVTETASIAINGAVNVSLSDVDISKVVEFGVRVSYNEAFEYSSFHILPIILGARIRFYHFVNSGSAGPIQCTLYQSGSNYYVEVANQVNEAIKVRLYARYI